MKIGELARVSGTAVETVRYYEREGLLPEPARSESNYRVYGQTHAERLAFIRHCRCLDMTLGEIRTLLQFKDAPQEDCGEVNQLLDKRIQHVVDRISELQALEKELRKLRTGCSNGGTIARCGVLDGLERAARTHEHGSPKAGGGPGIRARTRTTPEVRDS
jgi:Cd(II)/Pb(II)-responsive transcriptional regulator